MTAISAAICHAIHGTLPSGPPGITAAAVQAALMVRGIDRALTSIKQALPRMRRDGYVVSQGFAGHDDFRWWQSGKVFRQPPAMWRGRSPKVSVTKAADPEPAFVDRRPHLYPLTATALRGLPSKPVVVKPNRQAPIPTPEDVIAAWADGLGLPWCGWTSLDAINSWRRAAGRVEFAPPAASATVSVAKPMTHPMVRP